MCSERGNMFVKLFFGPYESNGIIRHRPKRLHGAMRSLSALGYEIELVPTYNFEVLVAEMNNVVVFRCNIKHLNYNMDCEDDIVCKRLVSAILDSTMRFESEKNMPNYGLLVDFRKRYLQDAMKTKTFLEGLDSDIALLYEINKEGYTHIGAPEYEPLPTLRNYYLFLDEVLECLGYEMADIPAEEAEIVEGSITKTLETEVESIDKWPLLNLFKEICSEKDTARNILPSLRRSVSKLPMLKLKKLGLRLKASYRGPDVSLAEGEEEGENQENTEDDMNKTEDDYLMDTISGGSTVPGGAAAPGSTSGRVPGSVAGSVPVNSVVSGSVAESAVPSGTVSFSGSVATNPTGSVAK